MILNRWKYLLPTLFLALAAYGCDSVSESRLTGPSTRNVQLVEYLVNGVKVVEETDPSVGYVYGTFDSMGGELRIGRHSLVIPAGAVSGPTKFEMYKGSDDLKFDLHATSKWSLVKNDVGSKGFLKPVQLKISYATTGISDGDASKYAIFWLKPLGGSEQQYTERSPSDDLIIGSLKHFSDYALAWP